MANESPAHDIVEKAVAEGGAYDVIHRRLVEQGELLATQTAALNDARVEQFGSTDMAVVARTRVRTENNCVGRDIVQVGELLLFGYNVFIGLKKTTRVEDVFALYRLTVDGGKHAMEPVPMAGSFLDDAHFRRDFDELYRFYSETRLVQLVKKGGNLLASFQIGERLDDRRVFRWSVSEDGADVRYIDNRGERDIEPPPTHDFEWTPTEREDTVHGRFPHINILDQVFVETVNGDLTVKIENNTEDGQGIYREKVEDEIQSLDDASIGYAKVGNLILIKVLPYKEEIWRYLVYNTQTQDVVRIDAIGDACVQLPEDHGIIFPGGYYLENGEYKTFDEEVSGLAFKRKIRSPNGEDVLYVFYEPVGGVVALLGYNLITKSLQNPIVNHGYALADDGTIVVFTADVEPTRVHPMQVWSTPYTSHEHAGATPSTQSFHSKIGNAELVRGVSDLYSVCRSIRSDTVSVAHYEALRKSVGKLFDAHYWIDDNATGGIGGTIREITETVELVIDEFEKVESIRRHSAHAMQEAEVEHTSILADAESAAWQTVDEYVASLDRIRHQRGHLTTIGEYRYIDAARIAAMDEELVDLNERVGEMTAEFLARDGALDSYVAEIDQLEESLSAHASVAAMESDLDKLSGIANGLDLLSELIATLKVSDATVRTSIVSSISDVYSKMNQARARARKRREGLGSEEAVAQFAAQFKLFSQNITNALGLATTPDRCEEQLTRLLVQLEEMESQFSEHERFLADILDKREEVYDTFAAHKQQLLDARQARAQTLTDALDRMLANVEKRTQRFDTADELNTYLASDALVIKVRDLIGQLRELDSTVKADDAEARLKMLRDQAMRTLRDKTELYADGGKLIKLGPRHSFSVNTEELDLTIIPRGGELSLHLIGTQYFEPIDHPELNALEAYWSMGLESESPAVYRGEYLAYRIMESARAGAEGFDWGRLTAAAGDAEALGALVRDYAAPRYREGYEKGVHDHDAVRLLKALVPAYDGADLLRFDPHCRGIAQVAWAWLQQRDDETSLKTLAERARFAGRMRARFANSGAMDLMERELRRHLDAFVDDHPIAGAADAIGRSVTYLTEELGRDKRAFIGSAQAKTLLAQMRKSLKADLWKQLQATLGNLQSRPAEQWDVACDWLRTFTQSAGASNLEHYIGEAAAQLIAGDDLPRRTVRADVEVSVDELLGAHTRIEDGKLDLALDSFLARLRHHCDSVVPAYKRYLALRHEIAQDARETLRLDEFKARPLSSFVRNQLINDAYLPIIGDNLAKQIGTAGESKRSDLSGLLMMISPPGYGKTTLMEYVASRLGLTFMKINCPSLGYEVASLDPVNAPNATARQELEKLNLALEMGDNVMLYLDDIQHTGAEFLQKFISLCDSTRRIEGVWKGRTRTYDMRGRKFCVVMAGNPYTESGETFKVPDMLANRADIYNLGDVLSGKEAQFELSYIENCLTSNPVLAPLATRAMDDVYRLIDGARGQKVTATDLSHAYSGAEITEITRVLQRLFKLQDTVLKVNRQYIASAAQDDRYRTEPPFLLQGSYRNMNKLAEKISAVMNDAELDELIDDHYRGEAQLLTQGAEANLLKLAELRGTQSQTAAARWAQIVQDFRRNKALGGDDADTGQRIAVQLADLVEGVTVLGDTLKPNGAADAQMKQSMRTARMLQESLDGLGKAIAEQKTSVTVQNSASPEFASVIETLNETLEHTLFPLVRSMDKRIAQDLQAHEQLQQLAADVLALKQKGDES